MHRTMRIATATLAVGVALLAALAAGLGVFARGDGTFVSVTSARGEVYEMATNGVYANSAKQLVAEGIGWDVFTLAVVAPALLIVAVAVARGSFGGTLMAAGLFGYFAYLYLEYAVTWAFGPLFPLFIVLLAASVLGLIGTGTLVAEAGVADRFTEAFPRRAWAALSLGMGVLLTVMWIGRITAAMAAEIPALHGETTMTVQALDLGLVVPVALVTAVTALRRHPAGLAASATFAVMFTAMSAAIGAMLVSASIVTGTLELPPLVIFGLATAAGLAVTVRIFGSARAAGQAGRRASAHFLAQAAKLPVG